MSTFSIRLASATHIMCCPVSRVTVQRWIRKHLWIIAFRMERFGESSSEIDYVPPQNRRGPGAGRAAKGHHLPADAIRLCGCGELHCGWYYSASIGASAHLQQRDWHRAPVQRSTALPASTSAKDFLCWVELSGPRHGIEDGGAGRSNDFYETGISHHRPGQ